MKITFGGTYTIDEFADAMDRAVQALRLNGVDGVAKVSVYLNAMQGNRFITLHAPDDPRAVIDHLQYDEPVTLKYRQSHPRIRPADESDSR